MNKKFLVRVLFACIALILVLGIVYSGLQILELTVFYGQEREFEVKTKTITRDGVKYYPRQDIDVLLMMGVNRPGYVEAKYPHNETPADMIAVMVFDEKAGTCTVLNLNRDAMVDMPELNDEGKEIGSMYAQLAYAHSYGSGLEDSCENMKKTVSNLLGGVNIDYYISMNIDAVAPLNDAVGGVTVNVTHDFSDTDASIPMGMVTLRGNQARSFVQSRKSVGDGLNLSRIDRQKEYMNGFITAFKKTLETSDVGFVLDTYNMVAPYLVSDLPISTLTSMVERYMDCSLTGILSLEGENKRGEKYMEFYVDEDALEDLRLELFYALK